MSEKSFTLKVYTPQGPVLDAQTDSVSMPGIDGEVGILPEHAQYVGVLGAGLVQYAEPGNAKPARLIISGGFASFQVNTLTILADKVDFDRDLKGINVDKEAEELNAKLANLNAFDPEWEPTQQKIRRLEVIRSLH